MATPHRAERMAKALEYLFPTFKKYVEENDEIIAKNISEERLKKFALTRMSNKIDFLDLIEYRFELKNTDILQYVDLNEIFNDLNSDWTWVRISWSLDIPTAVLKHRFQTSDIDLYYGPDGYEDLWYIDMEDALLVLQDTDLGEGE